MFDCLPLAKISVLCMTLVFFGSLLGLKGRMCIIGIVKSGNDYVYCSRQKRSSSFLYFLSYFVLLALFLLRRRPKFVHFYGSRNSIWFRQKTVTNFMKILWVIHKCITDYLPSGKRKTSVETANCGMNLSHPSWSWLHAIEKMSKPPPLFSSFHPFSRFRFFFSLRLPDW